MDPVSRFRDPDVSTPAVPANCNTLKNGDLSLVLHIPSQVAGEVFAGVHPMLGKEIHVFTWDMGD